MKWFSSRLAAQEARGSIPGLAATISEIGYLLLPSRDMAERLLKRRKSSKQPTKQAKNFRPMDWYSSVSPSVWCQHFGLSFGNCFAIWAYHLQLFLVLFWNFCLLPFSCISRNPIQMKSTMAKGQFLWHMELCKWLCQMWPVHGRSPWYYQWCPNSTLVHHMINPWTFIG